MTEPARTWQPIATAPRDGTQILVSDGTSISLVEWTEWKPGWYNGDWTYEADDFDYWQPLPELPRADGEEGNKP